MKYLKYIIAIYLLYSCISLQGQNILSANFVQNPSFELFDTCPYNNAQLYKSKYWWGASADYFNICDTGNGWASVPSNLQGIQYAKTGVAYAGFIHYAHSPNLSYNETYNETIKNLLHDSLKKNKRYCINYFASLAEFTNKYTQQLNGIIVYDSMGALFSSIPVCDSINTIICDTCAKFAKSVIGIDTLNWFKISGSIIANGGEKYLTIGKFNLMNWPPNIYSIFYVYVDDVSVCECSFDINIGEDTSLCEGENIMLNPNLPNATYTWQDSSHTATYEVKHAGTYWVRAYVADYDITTTDTIVITYKDCSNTIPDLRIPDSFTPNGDGLNDKFEYFYAEYYDIITLIYNRWGQLLFQSQNTDFWDGKYKGKTVHPGTYIYHIEAIRKDTKEKKIHCGKITVL
jgi:gliding motility-associated-like protein